MLNVRACVRVCVCVCVCVCMCMCGGVTKAVADACDLMITSCIGNIFV